MKRKIIAVISGAVILIIATGSIYGKPESGHKEGEPDVVGTFSINQDENLTVVANRENIEDREAFAWEGFGDERESDKEALLVFGESAGSWISLSGLLYCQFSGGYRLGEK